MTTFLLLVALCASPDPKVMDCEMVYAAPVRAESLEECENRARVYATTHFRALKTMPVLSTACTVIGRSS